MEYLGRHQSSSARTCLALVLLGGALFLGMVSNVDLVSNSTLLRQQEPRMITARETTTMATTIQETTANGQVEFENPHSHPNSLESTVITTTEKLPLWVSGWPEDFAKEMIQGSMGLTDKVDDLHQFQTAYQPILSRLVKRKLLETNPKIRLLEIGLGCAPGGGMIGQNPGGSALAWRHLFSQVVGLDLDLHIMEYDVECAQNWAQDHTETAVVHVGDASSTSDLMRVLQESGGQEFDVIIDDGSHINWHQIKTLDTLLPYLADGGTYFVEDIGSACANWDANMGSHYGPSVGGTKGCLLTKDRRPTILAHLMEYQRSMVGVRFGLESNKNVTGIAHVDIFFYIAAITKELAKQTTAR